MFEELDYLHDCKVIILGDFNIPHYIKNDVKDSKTSVMSNFLTFFNLLQYNNTLNSSGRILDLVLSNVECEIFHNETLQCT